MFEPDSEAYKLTDKPPVLVGDIVQVGADFYKVIAYEPLYYIADSSVPGFGGGFATAIYPIPDLIPPANILYYITAFGINGAIEAQLRYQANSPRNTVGARSSQRVNRFNAWWLRPFRFKFVIQNGDTLEIDVRALIVPCQAQIWIYGWKLRVQRAKEDIRKSDVKILEDVRAMG